MSIRLRSRLDALERQAQALEPIKPGLVVMPRPEGGYTACGQHFDNPEAAIEAFPDMQPRVIVRVIDARRPEV